MVDAGPLSIELAGHETRIVAGMKLLSAAHYRHARLRPGKHANSIAHVALRLHARGAARVSPILIRSRDDAAVKLRKTLKRISRNKVP